MCKNDKSEVTDKLNKSHTKRSVFEIKFWLLLRRSRKKVINFVSITKITLKLDHCVY